MEVPGVFNMGWQELVIVLVIVLIIFGPKKLPEMGKAIGGALKEFRKAGKEVMADEEEDGDSTGKSKES